MRYDLCIIGAGPAGLEAALQAKRAGLSFLLVERYDAGSYIDKTMRNKKFYHVYGTNTAPHRGLIEFPDRAKGYELVRLWKGQARPLPFKPNTNVVSVQKAGEGFRVETSAGTVESRAVILTSGTFENHKRLGLANETDLPNVHDEYDYYTEYEDERIVVVGGGNSALETAVGVAENGLNKVLLVVRKPEFHASVTQNNRDAVADLRARKLVTPVFQAAVTAIGADELTMVVDGVPEQLPYDRMFIQIGFEQPTDFLGRVGVALKDGLPVFDGKFESNVPGLYIAGALTGADSVIEACDQAMAIVARLAPAARTAPAFAAA